MLLDFCQLYRYCLIVVSFALSAVQKDCAVSCVGFAFFRLENGDPFEERHSAGIVCLRQTGAPSGMTECRFLAIRQAKLAVTRLCVCLF
jgi:hypothetical protein